MERVGEQLAIWRSSLVTDIPIGGLIARNSIVYKWKGPWRCWLLREAAFWRITELLTQSYMLHEQNQELGARVLLRSSFETLAILIYLNQLIQRVLDGRVDFHEFSKKTSALLLGSRDGSTKHQAINIVSILDKSEKRHPGISKLYEILSESAHPNFEGMLGGYSKLDRDEYVTRFSSRWGDRYGASHLGSMELCMMTFDHEYSDYWPMLMDRLEDWIVENDEILEATKKPSVEK